MRHLVFVLLAVVVGCGPRGVDGESDVSCGSIPAGVLDDESLWGELEQRDVDVEHSVVLLIEVRNASTVHELIRDVFTAGELSESLSGLRVVNLATREVVVVEDREAADELVCLMSSHDEFNAAAVASPG